MRYLVYYKINENSEWMLACDFSSLNEAAANATRLYDRNIWLVKIIRVNVED